MLDSFSIRHEINRWFSSDLPSSLQKFLLRPGSFALNTDIIRLQPTLSDFQHCIRCSQLLTPKARNLRRAGRLKNGLGESWLSVRVLALEKHLKSSSGSQRSEDQQLLDTAWMLSARDGESSPSLVGKPPVGTVGTEEVHCLSCKRLFECSVLWRLGSFSCPTWKLIVFVFRFVTTWHTSYVLQVLVIFTSTSLGLSSRRSC